MVRALRELSSLTCNIVSASSTATHEVTGTYLEPCQTHDSSGKHCLDLISLQDTTLNRYGSSTHPLDSVYHHVCFFSALTIVNYDRATFTGKCQYDASSYTTRCTDKDYYYFILELRQ